MGRFKDIDLEVREFVSEFEDQIIQCGIDAYKNSEVAGENSAHVAAIHAMTMFICDDLPFRGACMGASLIAEELYNENEEWITGRPECK